MRKEGSDAGIRLDLFLALSRLIKRRTVAKKACEEGMILLNGREAKAGRKVVPGDLITVVFPRRKVTVRVMELPKRGARLGDVFQVISEEECKEEP